MQYFQDALHCLSIKYSIVFQIVLPEYHRGRLETQPSRGNMETRPHHHQRWGESVMTVEMVMVMMVMMVDHGPTSTLG